MRATCGSFFAGTLTAIPLLLVAGAASALEPIEELGKYIFFDKISNPPRMACVTCHDPDTGGTGSNSGVNLHQVAITGANPHTVGNLKPPTNAYASLIARFGSNTNEGDNVHKCVNGARPFCGGNFWNGRAEGNKGAAFPDGATKHIGDEVFYETNGNALPPAIKTSYQRYQRPTADQALNPMPNPVEQNIMREGVCNHVKSAKYAPLYEKAWGVEIDCTDTFVIKKAEDVDEERAYDISFKRMMLAVAAWQDSDDLNSFSSKRDKALGAELACLEPNNGAYKPYADPKVCRDPDYLNSPGKFPLAGFTDQENRGHDLFYNVRAFGPPGPGFNPNLPVAQCAFCHSDNPRADLGDDLHQLYADDSYHNIGVPKNPEIPPSFGANGLIDPDQGLEGHTGDPADHGFFKTPTMRNVDKRKGKGFTKAYTHNGWFKSLESLVHFYNTRDVLPKCANGIVTEKQALANNCWPVAANLSSQAAPLLVGNLGLEPEDEADIVAYLKTLTDTHTAVQPKPYKP